ncbi:hypothetical protein DL93DRAFT_2165216 [Clavulina sp. PMI_390]|nr:hypothetical protein DL93DRAFT_2165216 [Clavulina sp. PMI_390]
MPLRPFKDALQAVSALEESIEDGVMRDPFTPSIIIHPPTRRANHERLIRKALEDLDLQCSGMDTIFDALQRARKKLLQKRARAAAALAPVFGLPVELLREIFRLVAQSSQSSVCSIVLVCSDWHSIVASQSELWAYAHIVGEARSTALGALNASDPHPISLEVFDHHLDLKHHLNQVFEGKEDRLRLLQWESAIDIDSFFTYGEPKMTYPHLESIDLSLQDDCVFCGSNLWDPTWDPPPKTFLLDNWFPALVLLKSRGVDLVIPTNILNHLQHLVLENVAVTSTLGYNISQSAHSLRSLSLSHAIDTEFAHFYTLQKFTLPYLESLILLDVSFQTAERFFQSWECPLLRSLTCNHLLLEEDDGAEDPVTHLSQANDFFMSLSALEELVVTKNPNSISRYLTSPLRNCAPKLGRLVISSRFASITPMLPFLNHLASTIHDRNDPGGHDFVIEAMPLMVSWLKEAFPTITIISSDRRDCAIWPDDPDE